jgi:HEAT repeat protein
MPYSRATLVALVCLFSFLFAAPAQDTSTTTPAGSTKERLRAVKDLAKTGSEAIPRLEPYLKDPDLGVRVEAVKAISELGTQKSLEPLVQATRDNDPEIQIRATDGLVNFYLPGYLKTGFSGSLKRAGTAIKGKFTDTNDQVIDTFVMVRPEIITALGRLVTGGSSMEARANAARALGILRGKAAEDQLVAALKSKDDQVMYESLIAIQKIRDPNVAPRIAFLLRDPDERVQIAAIETSGLLQNKSAMADLRDVLEHGHSAKVRRAALTALAMLPDEGNRRIYSQYLKDKDDALRAAAAEGFARLKNPADQKMLDEAFAAESKMGPRLSLAFASVAAGHNDLSEFSPLQYLVNALNSKTYRGVAQPFLVELARDPGIRRTLYGALKNGTRDEKIYLGQALARSGDAETVKYLEALAADPDSEVSQEGLRALRTLKARL